MKEYIRKIRGSSRKKGIRGASEASFIPFFGPEALPREINSGNLNLEMSGKCKDMGNLALRASLCERTRIFS